MKTSTVKNFSTNHGQVRRSIANQKLFAQQIEISEFLSSDLKMEVTQIIREGDGFDSKDDHEFMHDVRQYYAYRSMKQKFEVILGKWESY